MPQGSNKRNLTGLKFGRLTAVSEAGRSKAKNVLWSCQCECGEIVVVHAGALTNGNTKSCGCIVREMSTKHGLSTHPLYRIWWGIMRRCYVPAAKGYSRYGGRGIQVCERWKSVANFIEDMNPRPSKRHSVERVENDGMYSPDNCVWSLPKQQGRNSSTNRLVAFKGRTQCVTAWAEEIGINYITLFDRLRRGWPVEKALTQPVRKRST